jgi:hypothetical protein
MTSLWVYADAFFNGYSVRICCMHSSFEAGGGMVRGEASVYHPSRHSVGPDVTIFNASLRPRAAPSATVDGTHDNDWRPLRVFLNQFTVIPISSFEFREREEEEEDVDARVLSAPPIVPTIYAYPSSSLPLPLLVVVVDVRLRRDDDISH